MTEHAKDISVRHVAQRIRRMIANHGFQCGDPLPSHDILVRQLEVPATLVHLALTDLQTRQWIEKEKQGYRIVRHMPVHSPVLSEIALVAFCPRQELLELNYMREVMNGMLAACDWAGVDLRIHSYKEQHSAVQPDALAAAADGVILLGITNDEYIRKVAETQIPTVSADYQPRGVSVHSLACDNAGAVDAALEHLLKLGHRRIAFLSKGSLANGVSCRERRDAYLNMMHLHEISTSSLLFYLGGGGTGMQVPDLVQAIRHPTHPITAVLVDDVVAGLPLDEALRDAGLKVPQDVSLAVAAGTHRDTLLPGGVALTYSEIDFEEMGRRAIQELSILCEQDLPNTRKEIRIGYTFRQGATAIPFHAAEKIR